MSNNDFREYEAVHEHPSPPKEMKLGKTLESQTIYDMGFDLYRLFEVLTAEELLKLYPPVRGPSGLIMSMGI